MSIAALPVLRPALLVALAFVVPAVAAEGEPVETPAGHSYHGEAFNEGPRQAARLIGGTGRVRFPVTTKSPEAQAFVEQGLGQLHGFWYFEAERSFRQAATLDPGCAMAYWGLAWANVNNRDRAKEFAVLADGKKGTASPRERLYVEATKAYFDADPNKKKERGAAYVRALEKILFAHPDDVEAKALLALQLWQNRKETPLASPLAVDALLDRVFAAAPDHPAHHYRIHLWDDVRPESALTSAARCGPAAPAIAHMWHMPGHTYAKLKRYHDAAWQQEASARVDHAHTARAGLLPDEIHNYAHNNEWLVRDLNHVGRSDDAVALAKNLIELPRHPKYNTPAKGSANFGRLRLLETLDRFERWEELVSLCDTAYLAPSDDEKAEAVRLRYLGKALCLTGKSDRAEKMLADLRNRLERLKVAAYDAPKEAKAGKDADGKSAKTRKEIDEAIAELGKAVGHVEGWRLAAAGDHVAARARLGKAGDADGMDLAVLRFRAGERDKALSEAKAYVEKHENEVVPLAHYVDLLAQADKTDAAAKAFDRLRTVASDAVLDDPPLVRLAPLAESLGLPADWRRPRAPAADVGPRPDLDALGPFLWQPPAAPDWKLTDAAGAPYGLDRHRGRPVVLIFYLGFGCLHCVEQLQTFAPTAAEFEAAGIDVVAIGTDAPSDLARAAEDYGDGKFPFPLVSDAALTAFKAYGCHDDFEGRPLHGTFFLDGRGRVRWRDVGHEPFTDAAFVLGEARRLLALDAAR